MFLKKILSCDWRKLLGKKANYNIRKYKKYPNSLIIIVDSLVQLYCIDIFLSLKLIINFPHLFKATVYTSNTPMKHAFIIFNASLVKKRFTDVNCQKLEITFCHYFILFKQILIDLRAIESVTFCFTLFFFFLSVAHDIVKGILHHSIYKTMNY